MLPFARFQSSRTADADTLALAFQRAGLTPQAQRSKARRAYGADGVHAGRPYRVEGKWAKGRTTDVPVLTVTLHAPLWGGQFRYRRDLPQDAPLPVPGNDTLIADGSPHAGLAAALHGTLGEQMVALAAVAQDFSALNAGDDRVELRLSGWPPSERELLAAIDLAATLADVMAAVAPGTEAESAAWLEDEQRRLRRSRRIVLGMLTIALAPIVTAVALGWPA
jgi:hypothetical protein